MKNVSNDDKIVNAGIILGVGSANERRCYIVTSSLSDWAHSQNDPCCVIACPLQLLIQ